MDADSVAGGPAAPKPMLVSAMPSSNLKATGEVGGGSGCLAGPSFKGTAPKLFLLFFALTAGMALPRVLPGPMTMPATQVWVASAVKVAVGVTVARGVPHVDGLK